MGARVYLTSEILRALKVPFYRFEYLIRLGKVQPIAEGRRPGRERRFTEGEFQKARALVRSTSSKSSKGK